MGCQKNPEGLSHPCLLMPGVKEEKGAELKITKGEAQEQEPVMKTERRARKKVLNISLGVVQTGGVPLAPGKAAVCPCHWGAFGCLSSLQSSQEG